MPDRARVLLEVVAGIIPNQPMPEYTKQFAITEEQWADPTGIETMKVYGLVQEYMRNMWNPKAVNWVRCDWIYL